MTKLHVLEPEFEFRSLWLLCQFIYLYTALFVKGKVIPEKISKVSFRLMETHFDDAMGAILVLLPKQFI